MNETLKDFYKRISLFLVGFLGMYVVIIAIQLLNGLNILFKTFDIPLLVNRVNFFANYSVMLNYAVYITTFLIILFILGEKIFRKIILEFKISQNIKDGIVFGIILVTSTVLYNNFIRIIFPNVTENQNEESVRSIIGLNPLLSAFVIAIIGPVVEEFTYRFGLFGSIRKKSRVLAYLATIIIFALIHFNFANESMSQWINELLNLPGYMLAAFILSYAYDRNQNLSVSIIAHVFNNGFSVLMTLLLTILPEA